MPIIEYLRRKVRGGEEEEEAEEGEVSSLGGIRQCITSCVV